MAKDDKELGEWIATSIVNTTVIKQFKHGFSVKKRGEDITEKIKVVTETTPKDMVEIIGSAICMKNYKKNTEAKNGIPPTAKAVGILPNEL